MNCAGQEIEVGMVATQAPKVDLNEDTLWVVSL